MPTASNSTIGHDQHRFRRGALNPFFSKQKITALESVMQAQVEKLSKRIEEFAASGKVLPNGTAYSAFTMDVVTEYCMEKSYGNLDYEDFNQSMADCVKGIGPVWRLGKHMTWIPSLFAAVSSCIIESLDPKSGQ